MLSLFLALYRKERNKINKTMNIGISLKLKGDGKRSKDLTTDKSFKKLYLYTDAFG